MTTVLEKAAKAARDKYFQHFMHGREIIPFEEMDDEHRKFWADIADVALEAIEEPSEEMIGAGAHVLTGSIAATCCHVTGGYGKKDGTFCECRDTAKDSYSAMIRAARKSP